mmetsp:Transcript_46021/g.131826  ORF Transcript_46021/g.131826 Transcript_46021/m.131826 type:complete len:334 (+) Transcript_46021:428-1429(+)
MRTQLHAAEIAHARVLEQLGDLCVSQRGLAELHTEACWESALDAGEGNGLASSTDFFDQSFHASAQHVPSGDGSGRAAVDARLLQLCAPVLDHGLRAAIRHEQAAGVAQDFLVDRELHNVANLTQGVASQEGQTSLNENLCASITSTRQLLSGLGDAAEVGSRIAPQVLWIQVHRAINVHECLCLAGEKNHPIRAFLLNSQLLRESAAQGPQLLDIKCELPTSCNLSELVNALPKNPPVWAELVPVQACDRNYKLRKGQGCHRGLGLLRCSGRNLLLLLLKKELPLLKLLDLLMLLKLLQLLQLLHLLELWLPCQTNRNHRWHHNLRRQVCCH